MNDKIPDIDEQIRSLPRLNLKNRQLYDLEGLLTEIYALLDTLPQKYQDKVRNSLRVYLDKAGKENMTAADSIIGGLVNYLTAHDMKIPSSAELIVLLEDLVS